MQNVANGALSSQINGSFDFKTGNFKHIFYQEKRKTIYVYLNSRFPPKITYFKNEYSLLPYISTYIRSNEYSYINT